MAANGNMNEAQIDLLAAYQKYTGELGAKIRSAQKKIFNQMYNEIVNTSPVSKPYIAKTQRGREYAAQTAERSGGYKSGWAKKTKTHKDMGVTMTVYNKYYPNYVHLIEFGHRIRYTGKKWIPDPSKGQIPKRVSEIQTKYRRELDGEIEDILKNT